MDTSDKSDVNAQSKPLANILLVDDSKVFIELARFELMEHMQLQDHFFTARNGEEALTQLHDGTPEGESIDLVLLDISMPEMDGFELLERMRTETPLKNVSVVMCTGSTYDQDFLKAKALGAMGTVSKPIAFNELKSIVDDMPNVKLFHEENGYALRRMA